MRVAIYARVSTQDQTTANQLPDVRRYIDARNWTITREYIDQGISGSRERRPALDALCTDARRRRFDVLLVWRLDRLGRSVSHLVGLLEELTALGIAFVSLNEGIDATTAAGRLQLHVLAAIAQFERDRIAERVRASLNRARAAGKRLGRPRKVPLAAGYRISVRDAARLWNVSPATAARRLSRGLTPETNPPATDGSFAPVL
jgi:DNA invertase Pin-like site-specific DNA recombinase